ncbi:DUF1800 family protein [Roseateles sp. LYH14W]|uniref:DUF1800 family protein n=1 Tax=Pelomonas parva TaxID=3299032 RepID=A0ABW7F6E2_9BURK
MPSQLFRLARRAQLLLTATAALLTACGGGGGGSDASAGPAPVAVAAVEQPARKVLQSAASAGEGSALTLTDTLNVRAYAKLAGGIGALTSVVVDGIQVAQFEVRSTVPQDYAVTVPALKPGTKVDVVYSNDSVALAGGDRSLYVVQLNHKTTAVVPKPDNSSIDKGLDAAAFDGVNVVAGDSGLYWNAALRVVWPEPNLTSSLTVRASAQAAGGSGATMVVRVNGTVLGTSTVSATAPTDFTYPAPAFSAGSTVDVAFLNAGTADGVARALNVHYLRSGTTVLRPTDTGVKFDAGSDLAAYDWVNMSSGVVALTANGALRGTWPAANMTDTLTVRASGTLADNVGPIVQIFADGILLGSSEIRAVYPVNISLPALPLKVGQIIEVRHTNPAAGRSLNVAYAMSGKTVLLANAGSLNNAWPAANLTDTLNIRARADVAGGTGAIMQVLVDNLLVGTAEVNSTVNADYQFAVPPMSAGRKVDLVYTNDGQVNGVDRNLYIAYLTTANTALLPTAAGNTFDRGVDGTAFDGIDVVAGSDSLTTNGALHINWPAANITSTVTVRASATPAGNTGALMTLWVNGVAVSATHVNSTTPTDFVMPSPTLAPGAQVAVTFGNPGTVDGVTRALQVQYLIAGSTFLTPTSSGATYSAGNLAAPWPAANLTDTLTVRAHASLAGNVGALMQLRVNGVIVGVREVRSSTPTDHVFSVPKIQPGDKVDVQFINDAVVDGQDRNLFVQSIRGSGWTQAAFATHVSYDMGSGEAAIDGLNVSATGGAMYANGATRFAVNTITPVISTPAQQNAVRLLQQASFGVTPNDIDRVVQLGRSGWVDEQLQKPFSPDMVPYVESKFALGDSYRPGGANYSINWVSQKFWATAATDAHQLRRRVGFALHQILTVSQADSGLYGHVRGYARYVDTLNRLAFGNYRELLEEIALSPMMGIYLSHMRNRPEDVGGSRMPDENFAREVMQLFSIGLHELNVDGSPVLDGYGQPVETYSNADVVALAKVFTGWSWSFPDGQLTETTFRGGTPDLKTAANDLRIDLQRMKAYPGQHSTGEKRLFASKPWAATLPAGQGAQADLTAALDALFKHPNVGPFIGRQLIQRLVTSHPSPAYVARVAATFNNNGKGVRGDLAAVVRAILMDPEAVTTPAGSIGKLREPVLAVSHWLRALEARSASGEYMINHDLIGLSQQQWHAPSVFGYFRPGYVPPNSSFANAGITVPELQLTSETTTARWVNLAMSMAGNGVGQYGSAADVSANLQPLIDLAQAGNLDGMVERLNLLLYAGRMSAALKADIVDAVTSVSGTDLPSYTNRARVALFLALAAPDYLIQR